MADKGDKVGKKVPETLGFGIADGDRRSKVITLEQRLEASGAEMLKFYYLLVSQLNNLNYWNSNH